MSKSHVGMGYAVCPVCGTRHDEVVLLDSRMKETLERENFTGFALCPEDKKLHDEGYIALVVAASVPEGVPFHEQFNAAKRTGEVIHIRYTVAAQIFNTDLSKLEMVWIDVDGAKKIKTMMPKEPT